MARKRNNKHTQHDKKSLNSANETSSSKAGATKVDATSTAQQMDQLNTNILSTLRSIFVVICPAIIIFAAARNTITWHCQRFWGASADFWQAGWDKILDTVGEDPDTLWVYGSITVPMVIYWTIGSLYTLLDIVNKPKSIMRYKIQPGMNEPVEIKRLLKVLGWVLINQTVVTIPLAFLMVPVTHWRGHPSVRELPTFHWVLFELAMMILIEEIGFYYSHRALHSKFIYKYIHKKHHEWTAPIAVTAVYAHPIEHVLSNIFPIQLGICIMGSHVATAYLWYTLAIVATLHSHSGYHLPFLPSPEFHDYHHLKFTQNYGVIGLMDRIHGTDLKFRSTPSYTRHAVMLNLTPPREMYPDPSPKYQAGKK